MCQCAGEFCATSGELQRASTGGLTRAVKIAPSPSCRSRRPRQRRPLCLVGPAPVFCRGATGGDPGLAQGPCRRRRRPNRPRGFAKGARALPAKAERGRGQESLLLRHGCDAPRRVWAPVLRDLRSRPVVPRGSVGARQRPQSERHRQFRQRHTLRQELQQCAGFQADHRRAPM